MTIEYQLEPEDLAALLARRPSFAKNSWSSFYYFGVVPALAVGLAIATQSMTIAVVFTLLLVLSGWATNEVMRRQANRQFCTNENSRFVKSRWTTTLDEDGIRFVSENVEMFYRWPVISRVHKSPRFVHLEMPPLQRMHIPLRAFRDDQHAQEFIDKARACQKSSVISSA